MRLDPRRGFTLIELLVSLILLVIVGGGLYQMLVTVQRVSRKQSEVSNLQGNLRAGMQLIQSELSEVFSNAAGAGQSDIEAMSATAITYRAMRGIGEACEVPTLTSVKVQDSTWRGRIPTPSSDSLLVYWDRDSTKTSDDSLVKAGFTGRTPSTCPDGTAAWSLPLGGVGLPSLTGIYVPLPVRTWEQMQIGSVTDNGQLWLGIRSISGGQATLVPAVGPLAAGGLDFKYYNGASPPAITANVNLVKSIKITLWGVTDRAVSTGVGQALGTVASARDSLVMWVELRNSK
jgi:prepilin-type N-terminal cleavage/methylation domain-containing protein